MNVQGSMFSSGLVLGEIAEGLPSGGLAGGSRLGEIGKV